MLTNTDSKADLLVPLVLALPDTVMVRVLAALGVDNPSFGRPLLAMLNAGGEPMTLTPLLRDYAEPVIDTVLLYDSFYTPWVGVVQPFMSDEQRANSVIIPAIRRIMPNLIAADIVGAQSKTVTREDRWTSFNPDPKDTTIRVTKTTVEMETFDGSWEPLGADNPIRRWASVRCWLIERGQDHEPFLDLLDAIMPNTVSATARSEFSRRMVFSPA